MAKRPPEPKHWIPISTADGVHHGDYEVSDGMLTVRLGGRHKTARASSTGVPWQYGVSADEALASIILAELVAEGPRPK